LEAKLSLIIGQETHEWAKIKNKVIQNVIFLTSVIFVITFLITVIVGIFAGLN